MIGPEVAFDQTGQVDHAPGQAIELRDDDAAGFPESSIAASALDSPGRSSVFAETPASSITSTRSRP